MRHERDHGDARSSREPTGERYRRAPRMADPFFDKPYEAQQRDEAPAWEQTPRRVATRPGLSANIRPKRTVAALFRPAASENNSSTAGN